MESLLRESMDEAQIPRGEQRTRAGSLATRAPLIAVLGLGARGLPTALALRQAGADVLGLDTSDRRLAAIRVHRCDLAPADHERLLIALGQSRFEIDSDLARLSEADAIVICVPAADESAFAGACEAACRHARRGQTIVLTATTHLGATRELLIEPLTEAEFEIGRDICVAFSPERAEAGPGAAAPRIVGAGVGLCAEKARAALAPIAPAIEVVSSVEAAEMAKLYEEAFLMLNASLVDRLAGEAAAHGLAAAEVIGAAAGRDGLMRFAPGAAAD